MVHPRRRTLTSWPRRCASRARRLEEENRRLKAEFRTPDGTKHNTSTDLDAGDTETEATVLHSGVGSMEWNTGASGEYISQAATGLAIGDVFSYGGWRYGEDDAENPRYILTVRGTGYKFGDGSAGESGEADPE